MSVKTKASANILIVVMTLGIIIAYVIIRYFQNASAFSLHGALNKLFGGFFQKLHPTNNKYLQDVKNTSSSNGNPSRISSPLTPPRVIVPAVCHIMNGGLPDPNCTPGATNPSVTQSNLKNTICVPGYTKTVAILHH